MNQLQVRCPSCAKLYQVDPSSIYSTSPHFQCVACPTTFSFEYPPPDPSHVATHAVIAQAKESFEPQRECPKCHAPSPQSSAECLACGIVFSKFKTSEPEVSGPLALMGRWQDLLEDYENEELHQEFLMACREAGDLAFARGQYEAALSAQGADPLAKRMLERIGTLSAVTQDLALGGETTSDLRSPRARRAKIVGTSTASPEKSSVPRAGWLTALLFSPFLISFLLILWGYTHTGQRNMIGAGIACALLSAGLIMVLSGRLNSRRGT